MGQEGRWGLFRDIGEMMGRDGDHESPFVYRSRGSILSDEARGIVG
jgi:hypothetical protein